MIYSLHLRKYKQANKIFYNNRIALYFVQYSESISNAIPMIIPSVKDKEKELFKIYIVTNKRSTNFMGMNGPS